MSAFNPDFAGLYEGEVNAFDVYFASLASMQVHPGAGTKEHKPLSLKECKDMAMQMLKIRRAVILQAEV